MEQDYETNYDICLTYSQEELEDLMDRHNILGRENLTSKYEMCSILARIEDFNLNYENLPVEMIYKINEYLSYEEVEKLALTKQKMAEIHSPYLHFKDVRNIERLRRHEIVKQEVKDFMQDKKSFTEQQKEATFIILLFSNEKSSDFLIEFMKEIKINKLILKYLIINRRSDIIKYFLDPQNYTLNHRQINILYIQYNKQNYNDPEVLNLIVNHINF